MKKKPNITQLYTDDAFKKFAAAGKIVALRKELISIATKADGSTEEIPKVDFVLSTAAVDRSKDTVSQDGWILDNFKKNPVVLFAHNSWGLPVGKAETVNVEKADGGSRLVSRGTEFTPRDLNQMGWAVGQMYLKGFLNAVSVGFLPHTYVQNAERGGWAVDFLTQELLEFSCVPVPANPEALQGAKSAGVPIDWVPRWMDEAFSKARVDGDYKPPELEYLERLHKFISPKLFPVPGRKDDGDGSGDDEDEDDPLLIAMGSLEAALIANTAATLANTEARLADKAAPPAQTSAVQPVVTAAAAPAITATSIADEVRRQLLEATGS